ncbi:MAG: PIG-L deacetylase family protein [Candidatus Shapirobacteria bacterium]|jgi:LmbE family N-acetylglucosaminyl deacetylase
MKQPITDSYQRIFADKKRVLVVFAHPDDLELYCGGTVARLISDGKIVRSVKMTSGEMGSRQEKITQEELLSIREKEDSASMTELGIAREDNVYLRRGDGKIENNLEIIGDVAKQIRLFQPDLIITHNPQDLVIRFDKDINWFNHRDHRNTGQIVIDASYPYARDILFYPDHFQDPVAKSWTCTEFLLVDSYGHEDSVFVDITKFISKRVAAHARHKSQYSTKDAKDSADFFTKSWDSQGKNKYETFRHVIVD